MRFMHIMHAGLRTAALFHLFSAHNERSLNQCTIVSMPSASVNPKPHGKRGAKTVGGRAIVPTNRKAGQTSEVFGDFGARQHSPDLLRPGPRLSGHVQNVSRAAAFRSTVWSHYLRTNAATRPLKAET